MPRAGFVGIIGRPNVGKSTLLNRLVGEKLAGVSPRPQTTRAVVRGILTTKEGQAIFLDTPGMHKPKDSLGHWMIGEIKKSIEEVELIYWMVTPDLPNEEERQILRALSEVQKPVFLLINKIDRHSKPQILPVIDYYHPLHPFKEIIPISAEKGDQLDVLVQKTFECLPEGPLLFPEDHLSDQNERFLVEEIIREKFYLLTKEELPYSTAVVIESFKDRNEKLIDVKATIIVERPSQKAIVIGSGGQMMKQIGQAARLDMEKLLGKKVYLELWVKTVQNWKKDKAALKKLGFR